MSISSRRRLSVAAGATLAELGLDSPRAARGYAVQARVNLETMTPAGEAIPGAGRIAAFDPPSGPGVRVDTFGYSGYRAGVAFDSLIAKVIVHTASPDFAVAAAKLARALAEFRIAGVETNMAFLQALVAHPDFVAGRIDTRFIETHLVELLEEAAKSHRRLYFEAPEADAGDARATAEEGPEGTVAVSAPLQGTVVSVDVSDGDRVRPGQQIAVLEVDEDGAPGHRAGRRDRARDARAQGRHALQGRRDRLSRAGRGRRRELTETAAGDPDAIRPDLAEMLARQAFGHDASRPEAVAKRRKTNHRTARENIAALVDPGSFIEYGSLAVAAQAARRSRDDLIRNTPADGVVTGLASVNGDRFPPDRARCLVVAYDYTVLAGTQGARNHKKQDRLFALAEKQRLPVVLFAEGGGGRPGDTEGLGVTGLDVPTFAQFAQAERPRAARRRRLRPLLRRQRRAARLLRRGDRDEGFEHRHGRPGDDRGRRAWASSARTRSARSRCRRRTASSTSWSRTRARPPPWRRPTSPISRDRPPPGPRPTSAACAPPSRRTGCASTTSARSSRRSPTKAPCSNCAPPSASGSSPRWSASRAGRSA